MGLKGVNIGGHRLTQTVQIVRLNRRIEVSDPSIAEDPLGDLACWLRVTNRRAQTVDGAAAPSSSPGGVAAQSWRL